MPFFDDQMTIRPPFNGQTNILDHRKTNNVPFWPYQMVRIWTMFFTSQQHQGGNSSKEANNRLTATGTIRNIGITSNRRDLNSNREGNHSRDSNYRRGSRDEATLVRTHQQQAWQQYKRQLEHLGTPTKAGMLTTLGTQQQELQRSEQQKELHKQKGWEQ